MSSAQYDVDFVRWTAEQAKTLREAAQAGSNLALDWENLAEEIDSLGKSQRRELHYRIQTIIHHFLKLQFSPATEPRAGWETTIATQQARIRGLLKDSPSLRREIPAIIAEEMPDGARLAEIELRVHGEQVPPREIMTSLSLAEDHILGDAPADAARG